MYRCRNECFVHDQVWQIAAGIIRDVCVAVAVCIQCRTVEQTLSGTAARTVTRYCAGSVNIVATVRGARSQVQAHVEDYRVRVRCTCCNRCAGCQRRCAAGVHSSSGLTAVTAAQDCYVVVEQRRVFQTVCSGSTTVVADHNVVGYIEGAVANRNCADKVFHHIDVRQVAAGIICDIGVAVVVRVYRRTVEQALAWVAARTVARYCTGGVNIVAAVRGARSQVQAHIETHCVRMRRARCNRCIACQRG